MRNYIDCINKPCFVFPIDGDCLTVTDGKERDGKLIVTVLVDADFPVTVNGLKAEKDCELYAAEIALDYGKNTLTAVSDGKTNSVNVFVMRDCVNKYRLSSDDNILFLQDINDNKDVYTSVFDNPYLKIYKQAHDLYGACVHLNLFYENIPDHKYFAKHRDYFNLSMMTDKFKDEFIANSDWLKFNFHAKSEFPEDPYRNASYAQVYSECKQVQNEIIRFAGKQTLSSETTTHYGSGTEDAVRALRDCGIKNLAGYFYTNHNRGFVSYFYPNYLVEHINCRHFWYDKDLDMRYGKIDLVLNLHKTPGILTGALEEISTRRERKGFIEIMIHEQYFHDDYAVKRECFKDLVLEPCKWLFSKGYKGSFISEI